MNNSDSSTLPPTCQACTIRNRAICADLDGQEIALLNSIGRQRTLAPGEQLLWEGDDAVLVGNVIEGMLKLSSSLADGREQIVGLVYPSDFVGRPFGTSTPYGVEALTDVRACVFPRKEFEAFAREHPKLEHKLLERTLTELDRTRSWMLLLGRMDAEQKLASFLLEIADRVKGSGRQSSAQSQGLRDQSIGQEATTLPIGRQQIADVLGLTIETVSRQFSRFKKLGLIDLPSRREFVILNRPAMEAIIA